jgi:hypothetical protein
MCGATEDQKDIGSDQKAMYDTLNKNYATAFGEFKELQTALTSVFMPILAAGPSQTGFSPAQETALRTQNAEGVATSYAQGQKATAQALAARGGGDTLLPSSISANILAGNTNAAAATRATNDLAITNANYDRGFQNWNAAADRLSGVSNSWNPNSFGSTSISGGSAASDTATAIANANNSIWNSVIGAAGAVGGAALGNPAVTKKLGFG